MSYTQTEIGLLRQRYGISILQGEKQVEMLTKARDELRQQLTAITEEEAARIGDHRSFEAVRLNEQIGAYDRAIATTTATVERNRAFVTGLGAPQGGAEK